MRLEYVTEARKEKTLDPTIIISRLMYPRVASRLKTDTSRELQNPWTVLPAEVVAVRRSLQGFRASG